MLNFIYRILLGQPPLKIVFFEFITMGEDYKKINNENLKMYFYLKPSFLAEINKFCISYILSLKLKI